MMLLKAKVEQQNPIYIYIYICTCFNRVVSDIWVCISTWVYVSLRVYICVGVHAWLPTA